ncbi:ATP-dependent Clp protease proteolytic subunit [Arthrobacter sp. M4]|uniref:ATP-dependent Clp protease proteolytic subunit n=1 Tax=Arthrobacter sp. M4 TaxID=218160 RepID=UPI001CDC4AE0|nr:ATP-dependent Clp protease proteolytic subunit [Arthrobacter sp. M4]MCA4134245.1 ATP-dependent Clp protease proteolytic subunit [Arthrobacter sp. M4]
MSTVLPFRAQAGWGSDHGTFGNQATEVRNQAKEIIDEILRGTAPEEENIRKRLLHCVARHPGRPEEALLEHLMARERRLKVVVA